MCSAAYFCFVAALENVGESVIMELGRWNVVCVCFEGRMTDEAEICVVLWGCVGSVFLNFGFESEV